MNERLKELRKALGLSGSEFGEIIGVTKMAVSKMENARTAPTEQTIKSICREFNVNESWLRSGEGEIFVSLDTMSLDDFIKTNQADTLEIQILKAYFSLDKDIRKSVLDHFKDTLKTPCP